MSCEKHTLVELKQMIDSACNEGLHDLSLRRFLASKAETMHRSIGLNDGDPVDVLQEFVRGYILQVPTVLEDFYKISMAADIDKEMDAFFNIAIDYFLQPLDLTAQHKGLLKLMDAAYLSHRLIEEINDQFMSSCGLAIAPVDNTESNVVMHFLIGESLANELDIAVHYSVEMLVGQQKQLFSKDSLLQYVQIQKQVRKQNNGLPEKEAGDVRLSLVK